MAGIKPPSTNLYKPCVECKKKRVLCVRVRRTHNMGHALLSVEEPSDNMSIKPTTYALWPGPGQSSKTDLRVNDPNDDYAKDPKAWDPKDVKCTELDEKGEKKLEEAVNKPEKYNFLDGNWCSTWAGGTYNGIAGSNLSTFTPGTLGDSVNPSGALDLNAGAQP